MSYASFLAKTIKNSGYSLRAIARLCEQKYNVKITASYLSKLQQEGNKNPASEKVNIAIAKVCKINPDDLIFEADLERAPENVKKVVNLMVDYIKSIFISFSNMSNVKNEEEKEKLESELNRYINMGTREFITEMISQEDINIENPFNQSILIQDENNNYMEDIFMKFTVGIKMLDSSMSPIIKQDAKIEIVKLDEYSNGDIVYVTLKDGKNLIRTYVENDKNIILIPVNKEFETLIIPKEDIEINGKVKSYTIEL